MSRARQVYAAATAKGMEADFSVMIRLIEELAGVPLTPDAAAGSEVRAEA